MSSSRRSFLGTATALAGAVVIPRGASAEIVPAPWGIKLGVATYSLRSFDRPHAIQMIQSLQTPWISIKDVHLSQKATAAETQAGRREFEAAGLRIMSGGNVDLKETTVDAMRPHFEYAKNAGMPMMVCAPTPDNVKIVEALVKEYDIRCALHNHGPEDKNFPTPQSVLKAVRDLDPRVGLCMDIGHSARTGVDVVQSIAEAGSRLLDMHVKDLADMAQKDSQCDVGDGKMPFPAIFKQLKKMNYQGCVNLEYEIHEKDPMPGMQRSFSYLRGVLAGLEAA
jgi:sugar phosphate isomerase/epimerase